MVISPDRSILDLQGRALVVPVNRRGAMGAGLAKAVAERWPAVLDPYRAALRAGGLTFGKALTVAIPEGVLILTATKDDWRDPSRIEWVDAALVGIARHLRTDPYPGVHLPALGCGCGGLAWHDVKKLIDLRLISIPAKVYRYAPSAR